ncbi:PAS domain S-box protein [Caenimonas sp. SL110]|uniref:PAS domain S-box protein n=1 Tax=Caenimonas sp. SL110 TaxID=1450524 RepID=UPI00128B4533|nr:PAS domain S-box protein [Caenimonas sp. SL110]
MTRTFGLRAALTLLVLIAISPVFAVVVQASLAEQEARLARAQATLQSVVDLGAAHQESLVEGARQMLAAIAYSPPVFGGSLQECSDYLRKLQKHYPVGYGNFGVLDEQGRLTCRGNAPASAINSSDRPFYRRAVETGLFTVGEFTLSRASGKPILTFGFPVYRDDDGRTLRGVTYLALDVGQADMHLRKLSLTPEVTLFVTDEGGRVLASNGARAASVGSVVPEGFLQRAIAAGHQDARIATGSDGSDWLYALQPIGRAGDNKLYVAGISSRSQILAPAAGRLQMQVAALSLIALTAAILAWIFGDRVLARPVRHLLGRVDALAQERLPLDLPAARMPLRELDQLDRRFADVARRLVERSLQRDAAMAEMEHQRHLLESVFEGMAEGVLVVDPKGRLLHVNRAAHSILGGLAALTASNDFARASPVDLGLYNVDESGVTQEERPLTRALGGESVERFRCIVRAPLSGGAEKVVQGSARPLPGPEGRAAGAMLVFFEVTRAWRAEKELRDSESRYRLLFDSNPHPMWVFDRETLRFLTVNDAAVAHYGYSRDEFLSMTIEQIRPSEDISALRSSLAGLPSGSSARGWRHQLKSGELIWVEISSHILDYDGRPARVVLAHDVTTLLEAHMLLERANETLEHRVQERTRELHVANRELESFAYSVSHDLRAPLAAIDGFGRALLAKHSDDLDAQARHFLERIRENTRHMGELIDDLLSLARVTRTEIRAELVNLAPKARQIVEALRHRFAQREVQVEIDDDILCVGDARLAAIALENLIGNAWKFTSRAAAPSIHVGSRLSPEGERIVFVADNGAGFDMAYAGKLFNAFHRLHASSDFEGTGIGLATVHRIVTRHGGRVWAQARPGEGATFSFTLIPGEQNEKQPDPAGGGQPGSSGTDPDDTGRKPRPQ